MPDIIERKSFWKAAGIRALKTFCQTLLVLLPATGFDLLNASFVAMLIASASAAVLSVVTSIVGGIPEAPHEPVS